MSSFQKATVHRTNQILNWGGRTQRFDNRGSERALASNAAVMHTRPTPTLPRGARSTADAYSTAGSGYVSGRTGLHSIPHRGVVRVGARLCHDPQSGDQTRKAL